MRSVKRIARRVAKNDSQRQAFECLAYNIPKVEKKEDVTTLFDALQGSKALQEASLVLPTQKLVLEELDNSEWTIAAAWCEWWQRPKHLGT